MTSLDTATRALEALGLTEIEARCYAFLQANGASTGYVVAKGVGRQNANVYKALDSLRSRGAIEVEEGRPRMCRAVAPDELLGALDRGFRARREEAAGALERLGGNEDDARVYHLETPGQVFERFRTALAEVEEVALLDLFPRSTERLGDELSAAAERGVMVVVKVYAPVERALPGVVVLPTPEGSRTTARWAGEWANGVFDGRRHLLALLDRELGRVHQAVWSSSEWIACVYHSALVHELRQSTTPEAHPGLWRDPRIESAPGLRRWMERLADDGAARGERVSQPGEKR